MTSIKRIFCFLLLLPFFPVASQTVDDVQVSLLTVMPRSKAVYTIFGHTALRLYKPDLSIDAVLNWGNFDSNKPNFLYHFFLGETDYSLDATSTQVFMDHYQWGNSTVVEQVINIPDSLKKSLLQMLQTNLQAENIEYRYNIFFNNCTTRPRDIIEKFCGGELIYPKNDETVTIRKLVHGCTKHYPWIEFGIDLIIGNGADSLISRHSEMFLPERLMNILDQSFVKAPDGTEHPIVLSEKTVLQSDDDILTKTDSLFTQPFTVTSIIFLIFIVLIITAYRKNRHFRLPFAVLFLIAGLGGCIVAGLVFFSLHPCTSNNWNLVWLHPVHLIGFAGFLFKKYYPLFRWYHAVNFVLLSCFMLSWHWIPQALDIAFIPIIGSLWLVSGYQYLYMQKEKC